MPCRHQNKNESYSAKRSTIAEFVGNVKGKKSYIEAANGRPFSSIATVPPLFTIALNAGVVLRSSYIISSSLPQTHTLPGRSSLSTGNSRGLGPNQADFSTNSSLRLGGGEIGCVTVLSFRFFSSSVIIDPPRKHSPTLKTTVRDGPGEALV